MKQRVALALTLMLDMDLLLCDEPTSGLDTSVEYEIVNELKRLNKEKNLAILIITHNLALAKKLCDKILVLFGGRIMEYRRADKLIENPMHPYTINLIKAVPKLLEGWSKDVYDTAGYEKKFCTCCHLECCSDLEWEKVSVTEEV